MDEINQTPCSLQPEALVSLWVSQYTTTSALAACSTALYGFNIALASSCVSLILMHKELNLSRQRQITGCVYIAAMIAIASHSVVSANMNVDGGVIDSLRNPEKPTRLVSAIFSPRMPVSLPLAVWGADGVLIYRCIILYQLVSAHKKIALHIVLVIGGLSSICSGIAAYYFSFAFITSDHLQVVRSGVIPTTIGVNGTVACFIAARLIYAQRLISESRDERQDNEPRLYMTALAICVESSTLIVLAALASAICQDTTVLMPQILVLSPLLIIYRVAQGRADKTVTRLEETLEFHHTHHASMASDMTSGEQ